MSKVFEDYFSELHADMVAVCLEYVENQAEEIFIYCSYEPEMYAFDVFYKINGEYLQKHELNKGDNTTVTKVRKYDTSENRQEMVLDIGLKNLEEIHQKCKVYDREMPSEMKVYYNVKNNSLKGKYKYDLIYSNRDDILPDDIFESWLEEVKYSNY
ncbi:DUF600 domain-containing protein [Pseudalkalibacillus hwajinpoensis]|uniref:DUF600 domain-containing protein n=1 Tax=Guptibacillus hwajinpoensis TaxID=208199 RepID=UPI001CFD3E8A|nr:DUF600 domain-containing protein [Pseudalkalibacillus hwajinpoensis]